MSELTVKTATVAPIFESIPRDAAFADRFKLSRSNHCAVTRFSNETLPGMVSCDVTFGKNMWERVLPLSGWVKGMSEASSIEITPFDKWLPSESTPFSKHYVTDFLNVTSMGAEAEVSFHSMSFWRAANRADDSEVVHAKYDLMLRMPLEMGISWVNSLIQIVSK